MRWPIYLYGFLLLVVGGGVVINPEIARKLIDFIDGLKQRVYTAGVIRIILGALLTASAGNARLYGLVLTLGIVMLLAGIACFAIPFDSITKIIAWYRERTLTTYRIIGIILVILSSILLFAC